MFHFRFDHRVVGNIAMARRIPCACASCTETLDKAWDGLERDPEIAGTQPVPMPIHPRNQPSYQRPPDCVFHPVMMDGKVDLNCWNFVELSPIAGKCDDDELDQFFTTEKGTWISSH